jgi:FkbM family methyltransferase
MKFTFREGTTDCLIFEGIFKYDEYKLPDTFSQQDIIIDIGAHVGFFTSAVLQRAARNIYAFEPDTENYNIASKHLQDYIEQGLVFLTKSAVWRSDVHESTLYYGGYVSDTNVVNTGMGDVIWHNEGIAVPAISFDEIILNVTKEAQQRIRLLKVDCEGSEWPILLTSNTLYLIDEICGEFHEIGGEYDTFTPPFSIGNRDHYTIDYLRNFLEEKGFAVTYYRTVNADGTSTRLGMFFATRVALSPVTQYTVAHAAQESHQLLKAQAPLQWFALGEQNSSIEQAAEVQTIQKIFEGRAFAGYSGYVKGAIFSPDGCKVLTGSYDGTVRLWDTASGCLLLTLEGHTNVVECLAFSPDGNKVLTGSYDGTARLWETESGRLLAILEGHAHAVVAAAFSSDGSKMLTGSSDRTARLWEAASSQLLTILKGHPNVVVNVAFSPDGSKMLTGSHDETVRLWETPSGRLLTTLGGQLNIVESATFSPDGSKIIMGSADRTVRLWETACGQLLAKLEGHTGWVVCMAFSPDSSKVLTGSYDGTARLWETISGRPLVH